MLISVDELRPYVKDIEITGVLHVGAHDCEELPLYEALGISAKDVIWVDAQASKVLENVLKKIPNVYHACVSDTDNSEVELNITNNSQSSSILQLGTHAQHYPGIVYVNSVSMKTTKIDTFMESNAFSPKKHNFWNFDIQGAELLALKGAANSLKSVDALYLEVNTEAVYKSGALITELDEYLMRFTFRRVITKMTGAGWGDALYIKDRLISFQTSFPIAAPGLTSIIHGEHAVIQNFIRPGSVVIDVGGNVGEWSDLALLKCPSQIHIFEPLPWLGKSLTDKFSAHGNISVNCLALSDASGETEFNYYEYCDKMSGFHVRKVLSQVPVKLSVPFITLSSYCTERSITKIGFLKIDTEGHEYAVLKGSVSILPNIDYIQFEYGGTYPDAGTTLQELYALLSAFGFKLFKIMETCLKYCPSWMDSMEDYVYCNYLAVSKKEIQTNDLFEHF